MVYLLLIHVISGYGYPWLSVAVHVHGYPWQRLFILRTYDRKLRTVIIYDVYIMYWACDEHAVVTQAARDLR